MGQKATKKVASANKRINARAIGIWQRRMMGMQVQEIAKELGIHDATVWRNLKAVEQSGVIEDKVELELKKHEELWGLALACVIASMKRGELRAAEDIFKYTGVWTDKLEVTGKVAPDEQQKKFYENMETLLKLKLPGGEVQMVDQSKKIVDTEPTENVVAVEKTEKPKAVFNNPKSPRFGQIVDLPIHQQDTKCTCDYDQDDPATLGAGRKSDCPVHGNQETKTKEESSYLSDCTCPPGHTVTECPYHRYIDRLNKEKETKDQETKEGGHPPPRGSDG